jgi:hypothetical protein
MMAVASWPRVPSGRWLIAGTHPAASSVAAAAARLWGALPSTRGLHSFTFQLNLSAF